jgi:hypothetical protein
MKKDAIFKWDDNCHQAFVELKDLFINAPVVEADASGWATGAVLS